MKKLSLDPEALQVESFDVSHQDVPRRGSVRANDSESFTPVPSTTDPNRNCACQSGTPCVFTLHTACMPECDV